jgi:hypothetical protein
MITCFSCGGSIDVIDRYCRWCGRTFIPDNYGPPPLDLFSTANNDDIQPSKRVKDNGCSDYIECNGIGLALTQQIFHDDEEELNDVMDLIDTRAPLPGANQGY